MSAIRSHRVLQETEMYGPPEEFEPRQKEFAERSEELITHASRMIGIVLRRPIDDIRKLFDTFIDRLADSRRRIAMGARTPNARLFGLPYGGDEGVFPYTHLIGPYEAINNIAVSRVLQLLRETQPCSNTVTVKEVVLGRTFSYKVEVLESRAVASMQEETFERLYAYHAKEGDLKMPAYEMQLQMKKKDPGLYRLDKLTSQIYRIKKAFPEISSGGRRIEKHRKEKFVIVSMRTEMNRKMVATARLITWINDRILKGKARPVVTVFPQDIYLHDFSIGLCSKIFHRIIQWDRNEATYHDFRKDVALMRYLLAVATPRIRGSAAIGEWLEGAIYRFHQYGLKYHPSYQRQSVDLDAITAPLFSEFLEKYNRLVITSKLGTT